MCRNTLEQRAAADALTGLDRRQAGEGYLRLQLENSRSMSVVMINLRAFKQLNERWGHACGDRVLQSVSKILDEYSAAFEMICRWDGDKFLMISSSEQEPEELVSALQARLACEIRIHALVGLACSKTGDNAGALIARVEADIERQKCALPAVA
jgi:diguanylate cyclase (GGDEF)-like protein